MVDTPTNSAAPRRSARDRKQAQQFKSLSTTSSRKRRYSDLSDSADEPDDAPGKDQDDEEGSDTPREEEESDAEEAAKKRKAKTKAKGKTKAKAPPAKKPRTANAVTATTRKAAGTTKRARCAPKDANFDAKAVTKETKISDDNPLFNAIMNPSAALQSTVDDFLEALQQDAGLAFAEVTNLVLRTCGCNDTVNSDEAVDYDGVVDALDNFTELLKQDDSPVYPLTSKLPIFKRFRRSLSEFIERLIKTAAESKVLYSSELMLTLNSWVIPMSSSQLRSFRHTATVIALEILTALCDVAAATEKQSELVSRQRQGDKKRRENKGAGAVSQKNLEKKAAALTQQRSVLAEHIDQLVTSVFIHRYRDLDPNIRTECVHSMGLWFKKFPSHFLDSSYLRYVGWVLSDANTHVRLEAVKSLTGVYAQAEYLSSLNQFTERFKPRLIEMAEGDIELNIRVAVVHVLAALDEHTLLQDEEREQVCLLVFDSEPKIRKAIAPLVEAVWSEEVDNILAAKKPTEEEKGMAGIKALAVLLLRWSKALDDQANDPAEDESEAENSGHPSRSIMSGLVGDSPSRMDLIVEALWDQVSQVAEWEALLDFLLLDHSAAEVSHKPPSRSRPENAVEPPVVDEAWRLEEAEEGILLEVLVGALRVVTATAKNAKKGEDEDSINDMTRALIKGLPRLIAKHQTDSHRIDLILLLPPLMNMDLYLEMRLMTAYSALWDDISKQLLTHSSKSILTHAVRAIQHMLEAKSLSNANNTKILELEEQLAVSLRDAIAGRDEIDMMTFGEDEVISLGTLCARIASLAGIRDLTHWMEESEGGKQSSAWDIVSALAERGRLGYKDEELMVEQAMLILALHIMWKAQGLAASQNTAEELAKRRELLLQQRDPYLERLIDYCIGEDSSAVNGVKQAAFENALNLYLLFSPLQAGRQAEDGSPASLSLEFDEQTQFRCAGFMQAQIEQYLEDIGDSIASSSKGGSSDSESSEDEDGEAASKKKKAVKPSETSNALHPTRVHKEYRFMSIVYTFLRALHARVISPLHCSILLAHHGRLGDAFSACSKALVDLLRVEGINRQNGEVVVNVITKSLTDSFINFLDGNVPDEEQTVALAKLLVGSLVARGAQLAVIGRLDDESVVQIQMDLLTWVGKRLASYKTSDNKRASKRTTQFFRVLVPLLSALPSKEALRVKAHMEQVLSESKVEPTSSKIWDAQRAYEKRLMNAMSKTKGKKTRKTARATDDEGTGTEGEGYGAGATEDEAPAPPAQSRPKPKPRARRRRSSPELHDDSDADAEHGETVRTPRPTRRSARARAQVPSDRSASPEAAETPPLSSPEANGLGVGSSSQKKRPRDEDAMDVDDVPETNGADSPLSPLSSRASTPANDAPVRRKRVRH